MSPLILHRQIFQVRLHATTRFLAVGNLDIEGLNGLFSLLDARLELVASHLKLIYTAHTLSLIARAPQLDLSLALGEGLQSIRLALVLILNTLTGILQFSIKILEPAQEGGAVTSLSIS
jgi:hypothetical protein